MITRRRLLCSVPLAALGARALISRAMGESPRSRGLFVYNAVSGDASFVRDPGLPHARLVELPALKLGRWNVRIGELDDHLLTLDTESHRVHAISLAWVRRAVASGETRVTSLAPEALRTTSLHADAVPYRAVIHRDRVFVDYFAANRIEIYRWRRSAAALEYFTEKVLPNAKPVGLSDMLIRGDRLWVAASGISCLARICPKESKPDPHVFAFPLDREPLGEPATDARPSNVNAAGLYVHPANGAAYVINAGDYRAGYSSLQRIEASGKLGPEIRLPRNAGAAKAYPLDARTFLILQFSGEHAFMLDAVEDRVVATLKFDGKNFVPIKADAPLAERYKSDLQDLLADEDSTSRFFVIDSKREQLLHVAFSPPSTLELLSVRSLRTAAFRSSPSWGIWVGESG